jgi:hypothetical protein
MNTDLNHRHQSAGELDGRAENFEAAEDLGSDTEDFGDDDESVDVQIIEDDAREEALDEERLLPLFAAESTADYRARWDIVQTGFVDDPAKAVRGGDALVGEVINALARTFADERSALEDTLSRQGRVSTEALRLALRRHRAFFERLLSF